MPTRSDVDVVVAGGGPAGRAVAAELAVRGVSVLLVDPHPDRAWRATHCGWLDELLRAPGFDPDRSVRRHLPTTAVRDRHGRDLLLGRAYVLLDPAGAPAVLRDRAQRSGHYAERAGRVRPGAGLTRDRLSGERLSIDIGGDSGPVAARLLVDAGGAGSTLGPGAAKPASGAQVWQWASGLAGAVSPAPVPAGGALVMDWSAGTALPGEPPGIPRSFGYALDLGDGRHLVEETVLAGPRVVGVLPALQGRLNHRLAAQGRTIAAGAVGEQVAIPLDVGVRRAHGGILPVGVAAGTVHPASGYSVTTALRTAPEVADAVLAALRAGLDPADVAAAGSAALWTPGRRLAQRLLQRGRATTGSAAPDELADFFGAFFALPQSRWAGYLAQPVDPVGVTAAMTHLFGSLPGRSRARLAARWIAPRGDPHSRDTPRRVPSPTPDRP